MDKVTKKPLVINGTVFNMREKQTFNLQLNVVSRLAKAEINRLLYHDIVAKKDTYVPSDILPPTFDFSWQGANEFSLMVEARTPQEKEQAFIENGKLKLFKTVKFQGNLTTRIEKYVKLAYDVKLSRETITECGNIAKNSMSEGTKYVFEFTDNFDWDDGDYGDIGSCYWGCNSAARFFMHDNPNCYAIRFYNPDDLSEGIGRAWFVRTRLDNVVISFNAYGPYTLQQINVMLEKITGAKMFTAKITNYGNTGGTLWINGFKGYVLATPNTDEFSEYDFKFDTDQYESGVSCEGCGDYVNEDYAHYHDGYYYCEYCFSDLFSYCDRCDGTVDNDDITHVHSGRYEYVCSDCLSQHYTECDECGYYHEDGNNIYEANKNGHDVNICNECLENYNTCDYCSNLFHHNDTHIVDDHVLCDDCKSEHNEIGECSQCHEEHDLNDYGTCLKCYDNLYNGNLLDAIENIRTKLNAST